MHKRQPILAILLGLAIFAFVACSDNEATPAAGVSLDEQTQSVPVAGGGTYTDVSAEGLAQLMEEEEFPLVNVHVPYEGEIEGTDLFIPYNEVEENLAQLPAAKDARIVLYCRSGSMSAQAAQTLVGLGYSDVWNLDGGMTAWENSGRPLLRK